MNKLVVILASCTLVGLSPAAWAVNGNSNEELPNLDKRPSAKAPAVGPSGSAVQAQAALKSRVPGVNVSWDRVTGTPRWVSANKSFLTDNTGARLGLSRTSLDAVPSEDPHRTVKAFINEHSALFGHDASLLDSAVITRNGVTPNTQLRTVVWQQVHAGIPVHEGLFVANSSGIGELVNVSDRLVLDPANAVARGIMSGKTANVPSISVEEAIALAAANIGGQVAPSSLSLQSAPEGAEQKQIHNSSDLIGQAYSQLTWLPLDRETLRLCWRVILSAKPKIERYQLLVDAGTGEVLVRQSLNFHAAPASFNVYTSDSPAPGTPGLESPGGFQFPETNRLMVAYPNGALDTNASPLGYVGIQGVTSGNNADAFLDRDENQIPDRPLPAATPEGVFDFPLDLTLDPLEYADASTVQLFWRANWYHDKMYQFGFDEQSGNYQYDNFGRGGASGDVIRCLVQSGADIGNADNSMFQPSPDGTPGICYMFIFTGTQPPRDGSLDQEVVIHELTHGTSFRLLGAGAGMYELQPNGMGEGWSDFYAMALLSESTDDLSGCWPTGGYVTYQFGGSMYAQNYYYGIRRYPYSTDMEKNPLTFKDIDPSQADPHFGVPTSPLFGGGPADEVHNMGEVWCIALFEMWAGLSEKLGTELGAKWALQYVTDGLKLAPPNATYLEARDAILLADEVGAAGENYGDIWKAFAKRGMGFSARCPDANTTIGVVEAYDLPPDIIVNNPDGVLELRFTPANLAALFAGDDNVIGVRVTDGPGVTNATITVTSSAGTPPTMKNDGVAPDFRAGDATYTGSFLMPVGVPSVTLTFVVSAPDKVTSTNVVTYYAVAPPANDNFNKAAKVPVAGAGFYTSNKRATMEPSEPAHGNLNADKSLWYDYTSTTNATILVDSGGSDFISTVAVYTNNSLPTLQSVAAATGTSGRLGAYLNFSARAGVTYHIAVAGITNQSGGTVRLNILPNGIAETNAPTLTVNQPSSGYYISFTNRVVFSGSAVDPNPQPSGIRFINLAISAANSPGQETVTQVLMPNDFSGPATTNWNALVGLSEGLNVVKVWAVDFAGNQSSISTVEVMYRFIDPPNDLFSTATVLTNNASTNAFNTLDATKETGEPNHANNAGGKSAWWSFKAPADGQLTLSTLGSSFDTLLAVYLGTNVAQLQPFASNDDATNASGFSSLSMGVVSNVTYRIAVDGYDAAGGAGILSHLFAPGAVVTLTVVQVPGGVVNPGTQIVLRNSTNVLTATPAPGYQFDSWSGSVVALNNPLTVVPQGNMTLQPSFRILEYTDGFEDEFTKLPWTFAGVPWITTSNSSVVGAWSARSGLIGNSTNSSLFLTGNFVAGNGYFDVRVSSEANWDFLKFFVDGNQIQQWSGEFGWANFGFPITAGTHTLEWRYVKDANGSAGQDAAFIDNVLLPLVISTNASTAATLSLGKQSDGDYVVSLIGQLNQSYRIQSSSTLTNWNTVMTGTAYDGTLRYLDVGSRTNSLRYYRAVAP